MKAVVLHAYGDASQLIYEDDDLPELVRARYAFACALPASTRLTGRSAQARTRIASRSNCLRSWAAIFAARSTWPVPASAGFAPGMRVIGMANGTFAEYTVAKADVLAPIPDALSFEQAAALPLVLLTGAQLIERGAKVQRGQRVLVTGALGSVGRAAVHVAKAHGARVIAGVRGTQVEEAATLGAEQIVAVDDPKSLEHLHELDAIAGHGRRRRRRARHQNAARWRNLCNRRRRPDAPTRARPPLHHLRGRTGRFAPLRACRRGRTRRSPDSHREDISSSTDPGGHARGRRGRDRRQGDPHDRVAPVNGREKTGSPPGLFLLRNPRQSRCCTWGPKGRQSLCTGGCA